MNRSNEPEIGLFWFVGPDIQEMVGLSKKVADVPAVGGFKTVEDGHDAIWRRISRSRSDLRECGYEYFPRGRVNWSVQDGFILLADREILASALHLAVLSQWSLPPNTLVMTDPHYRRHALTTIITQRNAK